MKYIIEINNDGNVNNIKVDHPKLIDINKLNNMKLIKDKKTKITKMFEYNNYLYIMYLYENKLDNKYIFPEELEPNDWNETGNIYIIKYLYHADGNVEIYNFKDWNKFISNCKLSLINDIFFTFDENKNFTFDISVLFPDTKYGSDGDYGSDLSSDDGDDVDDGDDGDDGDVYNDDYGDDYSDNDDSDDCSSDDDYGDDGENETKSYKSKVNIDDKVNDNDVTSILKKESKLQALNKLYVKRSKVIEKFNNLINKNKDFKNTNYLSRKIEMGIYNYSINYCNDKNIYPIWNNKYFNDVYLSKCRNLYTNIDSNSYVNNKELNEMIIKNKVKPEEVAFMDRTEMFKSLWKPILDEKSIKSQIIKNSASGCVTDRYRCPSKACGVYNANYVEVQTRSADEPMTIFLTCVECGTQWKR